MSLGVPVQVICSAQSTNLTVPPALPEPPGPTPVTRLVSSLNQTAVVSVNQTATLSANQTATISINQTPAISTTQTAAFSVNQTASTSVNQSAVGTTITALHPRSSKIRSVPSIDTTGLQYVFMNSAGDVCGLTCKLTAHSFDTILLIVIPVQE